MKFFAKLSAFGVVAVLSTAIASATTYQIGSYATGAPNMGNQNTAMAFDAINSQPNAGVVYTTATQAIDPGLWHDALPNTTWISFGQTGPTTNPTSQPGGHFAADGTYIFTTEFTLDKQATAFTFSVLADDTTSVMIDGVGGASAVVQAALGDNATCQDDLPNCLTPFTVTGVDRPGALALLTAGTHTLSFQVSQIHGIDLGINFSSTIETGSPIGSPIPEPSSLFLMGTGLIGSAGALLRRHALRG